MARLSLEPLFWVFLLFQLRIFHHLTNWVSFHPRFGLFENLWTYFCTGFFLAVQIFPSVFLAEAWGFSPSDWPTLALGWKFFSAAVGLWGTWLFLDHPLWLLFRKKKTEFRVLSRRRTPMPRSFDPPFKFLRPLGVQNQLYKIETVEYEVQLPYWPKEFSGLSLVQLSDIHYGKYIHRDYLNAVFAEAKKLKPDLFALTGDFISFKKDIPAMKGLLRGFRAPLGIYGVLGNHDHWAGGLLLKKALESDGIRVLRNEAVLIRRKGKTLAILGVDDLWTGEKNDQKLLKVRADAKIFLAHQPAHFYLAKKMKAHLQLSGHCHGGQICFPILGPVIIPSPEGRKHVAGFVREGDSTLFAHKGVGCYPPLRTLCPPEIVKIILRPLP